MKQLESLDIYNNQITRIPNDMNLLVNLKKVYIRNSGLPPSELVRLHSLRPEAELSGIVPPEVYLQLK
jgi:Leucine-rich repeat (LRR) protein